MLKAAVGKIMWVVRTAMFLVGLAVIPALGLACLAVAERVNVLSRLPKNFRVALLALGATAAAGPQPPGKDRSGHASRIRTLALLRQAVLQQPGKLRGCADRRVAYVSMG